MAETLKSNLTLQTTREDESFRLSFEGGRAVLTYRDIILQSEFRGDWDQYEKVLKDSKVRSAMKKRTGWLSGYDWVVKSENPRVKDWGEAAIKGIRNFNSAVTGMLQAIILGYRVGEVVWEERGGFWYPKNLFSIPNRLVRFSDKGELLFRKNVYSNYSNLDGPPKTYLISYDDSDGTQLGTGLGESLYHYAWGKTEGWRNWFTFLSRFTHPIPVGESERPMTAEQRSAALEELESIHNGLAAVLPNGLKVSYLEAERTGSLDVFLNFIEAVNAEISQLILGQSLTQGDGTGGTGSFASFKVADEVSARIVAEDAGYVADLMTQILRDGARMNFGDAAGDDLCFEYELDGEYLTLKEEAEMLRTLASAVPQLPVSGQWIRDKFGTPAPTGPDDEVRLGNFPFGVDPAAQPAEPASQFAESVKKKSLAIFPATSKSGAAPTATRPAGRLKT